ncbi:MAG: hypothetical protein WKG07_03895 [Hymenobacter sp.]
MRFETKLGLFNGLSKLLLVLLGALLIPPVVQRVAVVHTDQHLREKKQLLRQLIERDGLTQFLRAERNESYADYNILKQEYITITPLPPYPTGQAGPPTERIFNEPRQVGQQVEDFRILSYVAPLRVPARGTRSGSAGPGPALPPRNRLVFGHGGAADDHPAAAGAVGAGGGRTHHGVYRCGFCPLLAGAAARVAGAQAAQHPATGRVLVSAPRY